MSFAADVKAELSKAAMTKECCALAEAYGVLLYCNTFSFSLIRIVTGSRAFAVRLPKLFKKAFNVTFDRLPEGDGEGKKVLEISSPESLKKIFDAYGCDAERLLAHHINLGAFECDNCAVAFLRGAFLAGGSVTDPEKPYHLELVTAHYNVSRETVPILMDLGFSPKESQRGGNRIIYFKQSETIEDFLTKLGAPVCAMEIMSAKVMKDLRNDVNRRVNCDTANVGKTVGAALKQLDAIKTLKEDGRLQALPQKLRETAELREANPELPLAELALLASPPVTKSCLNHRLRKIVETAENKQ